MCSGKQTVVQKDPNGYGRSAKAKISSSHKVGTVAMVELQLTGNSPHSLSSEGIGKQKSSLDGGIA